MKRFSCYKQLLATVGSVFDAYSAVLVERILPEETYRIAAYSSLGDKINVSGIIEPGKGLIGWAIRDGEPLLVNNVDQHKHHLGYYIENEDALIKAFMACPLKNGRGILCVDSKRQYSFAEKDQKILHLFADLIINIDDSLSEGSVSKNYVSYYTALQLIASLRKRFPRWTNFLQQFLEILSEASTFSYCFFASRDESGQKYFLEGENVTIMANKGSRPGFLMGTGLIGWMFRHGKSVFESDASRMHLFGGNIATPPFHSVICLPIIVHRITRGVLCLAHENSVIITDELKTFLQMAADYLALFLENLYLKSKLRFAAESLEKFSHSSRTSS